MRHMTFDENQQCYIVKDTLANMQCTYGNMEAATRALRNGIGHTEYETMRREALVKIATEREQAIEDLLLEALPFVENDLDCPHYDAGVVAKLERKIKTVLKL